MNITENFSLFEFNTFRINVKAKKFIRINSVSELKKICESEVIKNNELLILGGGSNILFTQDFEGIVLHSEISGIDIINETDNDIIIKAGSGIIWDDLVNYCVQKNWGGLENLSDIPGSVGAAPVQNIGAYGVEAKDCIVNVEAFDLLSQKNIVLSNEECHFGYRNSIFKKNRMLFVTHVYFKLNKKPVLNTSYGNLQHEINKYQDKTILNLRKAVMDIRKAKLPSVNEIGSAGSFFKNPVIGEDVFNLLLKSYPEIPSYRQDKNKIKIPAAWLIENCGLKGYRYGNTGTHISQPLVIVNYGGASGKDIVDLAKFIQQKVLGKFNIKLEPEVCYK